MEKITNLGIPTHIIKSLNMREQLVHSVEIIPIEVVVRNIAAGSLCKRLSLTEGEVLPKSLVEYYYKSDELGDPLIGEDHIITFGWATNQELEDIYSTSLRINDFLSGLFSSIGIKLVDFKLEFGRLLALEDTTMVLADELSPDNFRLQDNIVNKKLDKDRFRLDLGNTIDAYREVDERLGILDH